MMKFSVVVPSFNQAQFLGDCLESIVGQDMEVQVIVMDGGSTDGSVEIIKRYEKHLSYWQSQPDGGQSSAINAGFRRADSDILAWLCSDDFYLPGALKHVRSAFEETEASIVTGRCLSLNEESAQIAFTGKPDLDRSLAYGDYIAQPSTFWTREAWQTIGELREDLIYTMDWEWLLRAQRNGFQFALIDRSLAVFRIHSGHKTGSKNVKRSEEHWNIWQEYLGPKQSSVLRHLVGNTNKVYRRVSVLRRLGCSAEASWRIAARSFGWGESSSGFGRAVGILDSL